MSNLAIAAGHHGAHQAGRARAAHRTKQARPVDCHVGTRVRMRRMLFRQRDRGGGMNAPSDKFPAGALIEVKVEIRLPVAAAIENVDQWLRYALLQSGGISFDNPLLNAEPEEFGRTLSWQWHGLVGRREEFDHRDDPDGSKSFRVRFIRESPA